MAHVRPSNPERVAAAPLPFRRVQGLLYILVALLSQGFYFLWPRVDESAPGTSLLSSPLQFAASGVGTLGYHVCLSCCSPCGVSFIVQKLFSQSAVLQEELPINRCRFGAPSSGSSYVAILDWNTP